MHYGVALLLGLVLASGAAMAEPHGDGTDHALQREMERLYLLRTTDPQAFVAQARSLERLPPPDNRAQRETLQLIQANRAALEGRVAEAIAAATPLAEEAEDPALRLRAGTFVVTMKASTRDFEAGLRRLAILLESHRDGDASRSGDMNDLHTAAAVFYNELGQYRLALQYGEYVQQNTPTPRQACLVAILSSAARLALDDPELDASMFQRGRAICAEAGETAVGTGFLDLAQARFLRRQGRLDDALAVLEDRLGAIESTRYPRLTSEAYALDAEMLLEAGRVDAAERQAREALQLTAATPTSLPAAMAERVLYEVHRRRGENATALEHLQRHVAANRALAEESRLKALAFQTVQHEMLLQKQSLQVLGERHESLDAEAALAEAESRNALRLAGIALAGLLAVGAFAIRQKRHEERLRRLAQTDPLTGFANRGHFIVEAGAMLERARKHQRPVMLLALDLDHFKRINDVHGHLGGDAVLRAVADAMREVAWPGLPRLVGRIGGEEFAVLLDGATPEQALQHAEALRSAIAAARASFDNGAPITVTASFGLSGTPQCGHALTALMASADLALYEAKRDGRDRVVAADADARSQAA